jgi:hypothetical protein
LHLKHPERAFLQLGTRGFRPLELVIAALVIMPHTLYLHSGLTQNRTATRNDYERRLPTSPSGRAA